MTPASAASGAAQDKFSTAHSTCSFRSMPGTLFPASPKPWRWPRRQRNPEDEDVSVQLSPEDRVPDLHGRALPETPESSEQSAEAATAIRAIRLLQPLARQVRTATGQTGVLEMREVPGQP